MKFFSLISLGIIGVVLSFYGLYFISQPNTQVSNQSNIIAHVTNAQSNVRLKRSTDIHWTEVYKDIAAYEKDLLFTGDDSYAVIKYPQGETITLHPNSLVSLSKGIISLESGEIEIDVKEGSQLKLESFGETFELKEETKLKIVNNAEDQKVVPLQSKNAAGEEVLHKGLGKFVIEEKLIVTAPATASIYALAPTETITLRWESTAVNEYEFRIEFFSTGKTTPFKILKSDRESLVINIEDFPDGVIQWKVTSLVNNSQARSSFALVKDHALVPLTPAENEIIQMPETQEIPINFSWDNRYGFKQKFQIALEENFEQVLINKLPDGKDLTVTIQSPGTYYWRLGHELNNNKISWSAPRSFNVKAFIKIYPISLTIPDKVDFSLQSNFIAEVSDPNKCEEYLFTIFQNKKNIFNHSTSSPYIKLKKIPNGFYKIKVDCRKAGKSVIESDSKSFEVKTSPPVQPPKTKHKKLNIFVKSWRVISNLLFPTAHASDEDRPVAKNQSIKVFWDRGNSELFEIEVSRGQPEKVLYIKVTSDSYHTIEALTPGKYFWRVRAKLAHLWSPFGDYNELIVEDRITLDKGPLMVSPADKAVMILPEGEKKITFKWKVPDPNYRYSLRLYPDENSSKPLKTIPVTGKERVLTFNNKKFEIWWQVTAQSVYGNTYPNTEKFLFTIDEPLPHLAKVTTGVGVNSTSISQESSNPLNAETFNRQVDYKGLNTHLMIDFWPSFWRRLHGMRLGLNNASLGTGASTFKETEFFFDYLRPLHLFNIKSFYGVLGLRQSTIDISYVDLDPSQFSLTYADIGLGYTSPFGEKGDLELELLLTPELKTGFAAPPFQLSMSYNYNLSKNWSLSTFGKYKSTSFTKDADVGQVSYSQSSYLIGFGANWHFGRELR